MFNGGIIFFLKGRFKIKKDRREKNIEKWHEVKKILKEEGEEEFEWPEAK